MITIRVIIGHLLINFGVILVGRDHHYCTVPAATQKVVAAAGVVSSHPFRVAVQPFPIRLFRFPNGAKLEEGLEEGKGTMDSDKAKSAE